MKAKETMIMLRTVKNTIQSIYTLTQFNNHFKRNQFIYCIGNQSVLSKKASQGWDYVKLHYVFVTLIIISLSNSWISNSNPKFMMFMNHPETFIF